MLHAEVELELFIPQNFPDLPPFVRVMSPCFAPGWGCWNKDASSEPWMVITSGCSVVINLFLVEFLWPWKSKYWWITRVPIFDDFRSLLAHLMRTQWLLDPKWSITKLRFQATKPTIQGMLRSARFGLTIWGKPSYAAQLSPERQLLCTRTWSLVHGSAHSQRHLARVH